MINRWKLTDEIRNRVEPKVLEFIKEIEQAQNLPVEKNEAIPILEADFSNDGINPAQMEELLEGLGYIKVEQNDNGREMDFYINFVSEGGKPDITISGTGYTFTIRLEECL